MSCAGYQGRGLWVYSRQYRLHGRDPKHLAIAKAAFEFLVNHFRDPEVPHGWCVETGRKGSTEVKRGHDGLDVATTGYGTAFIAEGCIEVSEEAFFYPMGTRNTNPVVAL